jgi:hypothetical protein
VKDLGFAGHEWPNSVTKVTDYSEALVIESKGVLPGRSVSHAFEKREVFEISNARVDPAMGEVYLESGEFVIQSTPWHTYVPYHLLLLSYRCFIACYRHELTYEGIHTT